MSQESINPNLVSFTLRGAAQYRAMEAEIKAFYAHSGKLRDMKHGLTVLAGGTNPENATILPDVQEFTLSSFGQNNLPSRTIARLVASTNIASVILDKTDPDFQALRELVRKVKQQEPSPPPAKVEKPTHQRIARLEKVMERRMQPTQTTFAHEAAEELNTLRELNHLADKVLGIIQKNLPSNGSEKTAHLLQTYSMPVLQTAAKRLYVTIKRDDSDPQLATNLEFLKSYLHVRQSAETDKSWTDTTPSQMHTRHPQGGRIIRIGKKTEDISRG